MDWEFSPLNLPNFCWHIQHQRHNRGIFVSIDNKAHLLQPPSEISGVLCQLLHTFLAWKDKWRKNHELNDHHNHMYHVTVVMYSVISITNIVGLILYRRVLTKLQNYLKFELQLTIVCSISFLRVILGHGQDYSSFSSHTAAEWTTNRWPSYDP